MGDCLKIWFSEIKIAALLEGESMKGVVEGGSYSRMIVISLCSKSESLMFRL